MLHGILILVLSVCSMTGKSLANEEWEWSDERASIFHYFAVKPAAYEVQLVSPEGDRNSGSVQVRIRRGDETIHNWETHLGGTFIIADNTLVYSNHRRHASGCELIAWDLAANREIWSTPLRGLGPVSHSKYHNQINMKIRDGHVIVFGLESQGQYIEVVDLESGEMISNQVGTGEYQQFDNVEADADNANLNAPWTNEEILAAAKRCLVAHDVPDDEREGVVSQVTKSGKTMWLVTFPCPPRTRGGDWILCFDPSKPLEQNPVDAKFYR